MISPMTPPGTEVICINDDPDAFINPKYFYIGDLNGLKEGEIYTIFKIYPTQPCNWIMSEYEVIVYEIDRPFGRGFAIERFRYLELAKLDELLKEPVQLTFYVEKEKEKVDGNIS
jgi:hypothetical protein